MMGAGPYPDAVAAMPRVRQSTLSSFASCALASHLDVTYGTGSHRAGGGTILHRAIAKCLELVRDQGDRHLDMSMVLDDIYEQVVRQDGMPMASADPLADTDVVLSPAEWRDMRASLISWTLWLGKEDAPSAIVPSAIVAVERRYDVTLSYPDGAGGAVDRVLTTQLDALEISPSGEFARSHDWKTSWRPPPKNEAKPQALDDRHSDTDPDAYFQQVVHAVVVFEEYPRVQQYQAVEFYVRYANSDKEDPVRDAVFHRHQLPVLRAMLSSYMERFDKALHEGVWLPTGGTHCQYCPRPAKCTLFPEAKKGGVVTNQAEASEVLQQIEYLKGLLKNRTAAVKQWSEREGGSAPVRTPKGADKIYGPVIRSRTEKPTEQQARDAIAAGVDPLTLYRTTTGVTVALHKPSERHPHDVLADASDEEVAAL